jgi:hypothetical protein
MAHVVLLPVFRKIPGKNAFASSMDASHFSLDRTASEGIWINVFSQPAVIDNTYRRILSPLLQYFL